MCAFSAIFSFQNTALAARVCTLTATYTTCNANGFTSAQSALCDVDETCASPCDCGDGDDTIGTGSVTGILQVAAKCLCRESTLPDLVCILFRLLNSPALLGLTSLDIDALLDGLLGTGGSGDLLGGLLSGDGILGEILGSILGSGDLGGGILGGNVLGTVGDIVGGILGGGVASPH